MGGVLSGYSVPSFHPIIREFAMMGSGRSQPLGPRRAERMARLLSIVIPAFNEADRLPPTLAQLGSFVRGEGLDAEIVVVDDGSRDDTAAVVRDVAARDPLVRLIAAPHLGKG